MDEIQAVELTAFEREFIFKALMAVQYTGTATQLADVLETIEGIVEKIKQRFSLQKQI